MDAATKARLLQQRSGMQADVSHVVHPVIKKETPAPKTEPKRDVAPSKSCRESMPKIFGAGLIVRLYWQWPRAVWRWAWPMFNWLEAPRLLYAPWGLLIISIFVWRMVALFESPSFDLVAGIDALVPGGRPPEVWADGPSAAANLSLWTPHRVTSRWVLAAYRLGLIVLAFVCGGPAISTIFLAPLHVGLQRLKQTKIDTRHSHGSARWGGPEDIDTGNAPSGFILGRMRRKSASSDEDKYRVTSHVVTIAGTGAGKGIGVVIPNCLLYPGSLFVLDIKGENVAVTASARRDMGQQVVVIDPFNKTGEKTHACNWLDGIDVNGPRAMADAEMLVDALVVRAPCQEDNHWDDSAALLLRGLVLYAASLKGSRRHIGAVRRILTAPEDERNKILKNIAGDRALAHGAAASAAESYLSKESREQSGVLSTAVRHTAFLDDPNIMNSLCRSDFTFDDLKAGKLTVYLVMGPEDLEAYRGFVRATLDLAIRSCYRIRARPKHEVLFILDEFPVLGSVRQVERAISLVRGFGVRFLLLCQTLGQLKAKYREWGAFTAATMQFFGVQDLETARYVSGLLGNQTMVLKNASHSASARIQGRDGVQVGESTQHVARALLTPEEVRGLRRNEVIVFESGKPPQRLARINYLEDADFTDLADANPLEGRKPDKKMSVA